MKPAIPFLLTLGFILLFSLNTTQAQNARRTADCPQYEQRQAERQAIRQNNRQKNTAQFQGVQQRQRQQLNAPGNGPRAKGKKAGIRNGQRLQQGNNGKNQFRPRRQQRWN
jgi:hypothetical protein